MTDSAPDMEPTVFVVDDDPAIRDSLKWLIGSINLAVETFASANEFLDAYEPSRPGCLLVDIRMPEVSGLELQNELAARSIDLPIIVITGHGDVSTAVRAMKNGAMDFLEKPFNDQEVLDLVQKGIERGIEAAKIRSGQVEVLGKLAILTRREREVLDCLACGDSNKAIARKLGLSPRTVEIHRANVMAKMEAKSLVDLVLMLTIVESIKENYVLQ